MSTLKSSLIFWKRNKGYSAICLFGLAISLSFVILIADFTTKELSKDNFQTKADRIFVLGTEKHFGSAWKLENHLLSRYPEIEKICVCAGGENTKQPTLVQGNKYSASIFFVDSTFYELFDFQLVKGDKRTALSARNSAVISEEFAHKAFGDIDPMGMPLKISEVEVIVTGIQKNITNSIFPNTDIMIRIDQLLFFNPYMADEHMSNAGMASIFILEKEGADITCKTDDMLEYFKTFFWTYMRGKWREVTLTPMHDIYFSSFDARGIMLQGDRTLVLILLSVGILILLFAIINYINLTVAQSGFRAKEMATRRLLGSSCGAIFRK